MDLILNGQAQGNVAATLLANNFDAAALRPWIGKDGRHYIARNQGGKMVPHALPVANATLRHEEWKLLDDAVIQAAKQRLRVVADLRGSGLTYNLPNGMGKTVLETQNQSDITPAIVSMDPARKSEGDRPEFDLTNLPLPVIHKDFYFNARQIATSRNLGTPIDVSTAQLAARRVSEEAEKLVLGVGTSFTYGGGSVYGFTNYPHRITRSIEHPAVSSWTPSVLLNSILQMRQDSVNAFHYGPWVLYNSNAWDPYLDEDFKPLSDITLRERILKIQGIQDIRTADYLGGMQLVLVQQTSDVVRLVMGMDITTLQWETDGGMRLNFKVMAIMVPNIRSDFNGNTGIVHAVAA